MRASRLLLFTALALLLLVPSGVPAVAGPSVGPTADGDLGLGVASEQPPHRTYRYEIETRGAVRADPAAFEAAVASILGDARGWTLGGSVAFEHTGSGGDVDIVLASPAAVDAAHPVCSPDYSCRVGDDVLINDRNWREATPEWRAHDAPLWLYRQYVVNHEVGHWLGFGHTGCPGTGEPAPVMLQQSIDLEGCEPSAWPRPWEREDLGDRLGVPVYDDWVFVDVLRGDTHRSQIHAVAAADIARGHQGRYYPDQAVTRAEMASFLARALDLAPVQATPFDDVTTANTHWQQIAALAEADIARGHQGDYHPDQPVRRDEMASFLARALDLAPVQTTPFDDVTTANTHWQQIAALAEADIARGHQGDYYPRQHVSRAEMASFLARAFL